MLLFWVLFVLMWHTNMVNNSCPSQEELLYFMGNSIAVFHDNKKYVHYVHYNNFEMFFATMRTTTGSIVNVSWLSWQIATIYLITIIIRAIYPCLFQNDIPQIINVIWNQPVHLIGFIWLFIIKCTYIKSLIFHKSRFECICEWVSTAHTHR
jgi:hypothetical protein